MKTYEATRESLGSNTVVKEINARVFCSTFKSKEGAQLADIYTYEGTQCKNPKEIVAHKTCSPSMGIFVETAFIIFK